MNSTFSWNKRRSEMRKLVNILDVFFQMEKSTKIKSWDVNKVTWTF